MTFHPVSKDSPYYLSDQVRSYSRLPPFHPTLSAITEETEPPTPQELSRANAWWAKHTHENLIKEARRKMWPHLYK